MCQSFVAVREEVWVSRKIDVFVMFKFGRSMLKVF